jgi:hypothetical protein
MERVPGIREIRVPYDTEIVLRVPDGEAPCVPLLSMVIPAMDEEAVVGEFLDWCRVGIDRARIGRRNYHCRQLERSHGGHRPCQGARVLRTPTRIPGGMATFPDF